MSFIVFIITRQFGYLNAKDRFVIEPRPQEIFAASDSSTILAKGEILFTGEEKEILNERVFDFRVEEL